MATQPRSTTVERDWRRDRFAAPLRIDLARPLDRLLVEHFGDILAEIPAQRLVSPLNGASTRAYENTVLNFKNFCVHEEIVADVDSVQDLPITVLRRAVERWLVWRASDISHEHPLVGHGRGMRRSARGYAKPAALRAALAHWAQVNGLPEVVTNHARMVAAPCRPTRQAEVLTDEQLATVVLALVEDAIVDAVTLDVTQAWHARQLAAIALSIAVSLRPTDELPKLREENILSLTDKSMTVRLPRTKSDRAGRVVTMHANPTMLCPLWSLARFIDCCDRNGWQRGGYLLPPVSRHRRSPLLVGSSDNIIREPLAEIVQHLGFEYNDATGRKVTPHGLRAMTPTRAIALGLGAERAKSFTGHRSLHGVLRYDRGEVVPAQVRAAFGIQDSTSGVL